MPPDLAIFRRWKDSGDVIALFPAIPADIDGRYCLSYEHVGQHGAADFHGVVRRTLPATELPQFSWAPSLGYATCSNSAGLL